MEPECISASGGVKGSALCWGTAGVQCCSRSLQLTAGLWTWSQCQTSVTFGKSSSATACDIALCSDSICDTVLTHYDIAEATPQVSRGWMEEQSDCLFCSRWWWGTLPNHHHPVNGKRGEREGKSERSSVQYSTPGFKAVTGMSPVLKCQCCSQSALGVRLSISARQFCDPSFITWLSSCPKVCITLKSDTGGSFWGGIWRCLLRGMKVSFSFPYSTYEEEIPVGTLFVFSCKV